MSERARWRLVVDTKEEVSVESEAPESCELPLLNDVSKRGSIFALPVSVVVDTKEEKVSERARLRLVVDTKEEETVESEAAEISKLPLNDDVSKGGGQFLSPSETVLCRNCRNAADSKCCRTSCGTFLSSRVFLSVS